MPKEVGNVNQSLFYSDVTRAGGLGPAIQAQLMAIGSPLRLNKPSPDIAELVPFDWEVVRNNQRFSQVTTAKHERLFMLDFWDRGVCLAHGSTPLLPKVAEVINAWVAKELPTTEMQRQFPFVSVEPTAESHEQGAAAEVERKWQALYSRLRSEQSELMMLVEKAMEVPVLRRLFPFTSLFSLCLSRCTGYPFSGDCPSACPSSRAIMQGYLTPEQCSALGPEKPYTVADSKGRFLGQGDAEEAIELIVRHLPPDYGPAVQGTANDLG
jgi:hypothetical protein